MEAPLYNEQGKEAGTFELPEALFNVPWNGDLVHQVITSQQSNKRFNTAQVKARGAVSGGGKKPWRQKGTGRARHGSTRSPIWRGGGVTHGPTNERNYSKKINKRAKGRALAVLLSQKLRDGELLCVQNVVSTKTREASSLLKALAVASGKRSLSFARGKRALIALPRYAPEVVRSFANVPSAHVEELRSIDPLTLATYQHLIIAQPAESLTALTGRVTAKRVRARAGVKK